MDMDEPFELDEWISLFLDGYDQHESLEPIEDQNGQTVQVLPPDATSWSVDGHEDSTDKGSLQFLPNDIPAESNL
jgi:hypothetical protein